MAQTTITNFFAKRKRPATEDLKARSKVMVIDADVGYLRKMSNSAVNSSAQSTSKSTVAETNEEQRVILQQSACGVPSSEVSRNEVSSNVVKARKELSLGDIKTKLSRSARLAELRASMARMDHGREKLKKLEDSRRELFATDDSSKPKQDSVKPQLSQFNSIELEVPVSPSKSPMKSPFKSPGKGPPGPGSPAFKRFSSLIIPGTPAFPLPYTYRHLAELFRSVDTVVSLLHNRNEIATFQKLQPAVQEMSRRTFTEQHVAQMLTVYPEAYTLKQEKFRRFASPSKQDKYSLVLSPVLPDTNVEGSRSSASMTPSLLLERRRQFYNNLLEIVKTHHEEFLASLDPPLVIPRAKLTRWHPEFSVDQVPDVIPAALPERPNSDKCCSAKDVLDRARTLYSCNARMEKALEAVARSQSGASDVSRDVHVQVVDERPVPSNPPSSPFKNMQLSSALKGIPKALLEKVRARQAAKALIAMTRTTAEDNEAVQYSRLPELARILRNTFVAEKKGALPLETVLEKVGNSYRSSMSQRELEDHLRLLSKAVPGWLSFEYLLKTDFVKLSKGGDMNRVMKRLEDLAQDKAGCKS